MTTTRTVRPTRPENVFDEMTAREEWEGFGYLGERAHRLESTDPDAPAAPELVAATDLWLLEHAARTGLDDEQLFEWANSKHGRHFADVVFGDDRHPFEDRIAQALSWRLAPAA